MISHSAAWTSSVNEHVIAEQGTGKNVEVRKEESREMRCVIDRGEGGKASTR